jgi:signal transduction histidine kinase
MLQLAQSAEAKTADRALQTMPAPFRRRSFPGCSFRLDDPTIVMVHDLRNPLAAISGCAELLAAGKLDGEQTRRLAANVWRASQQMKRILGGFVSTVKGRDELPAVHNLFAVLSASCEAAGVDQRTDIDLTIDVSPEIDLPMDRLRMERVFLNLIVNALEAMPCGGAIHIAASAMAHQVRIAVEDTGPGIPPTIRERIFEPFATAGKPDGVGLGLAIARETVRQHGGDLSVESAGGARFVVSLPHSPITVGQKVHK